MLRKRKILSNVGKVFKQNEDSIVNALNDILLDKQNLYKKVKKGKNIIL
jgi:hypothetical protein